MIEIIKFKINGKYTYRIISTVYDGLLVYNGITGWYSLNSLIRINFKNSQWSKLSDYTKGFSHEYYEKDCKVLLTVNDLQEINNLEQTHPEYFI